MINHILKSIDTGGWESWLQVELAIYILNSFPGTFSREQVYYTHSGSKYDMCIRPLMGTNIYFEIKTQKNVGDTTTAKRLSKDIEKINLLNSDFKRDNVIIEFAITKLSNLREYNNFLEMGRNPNYAGRLYAYDFSGNRLKDLVQNRFTLVWYDF